MNNKFNQPPTQEKEPRVLEKTTDQVRSLFDGVKVLVEKNNP